MSQGLLQKTEIFENCSLPGYCADSNAEFLTDVSEQPLGFIFKGQESLR